jgi:glycosyltransferase involved in cell wall biosynthesis
MGAISGMKKVIVRGPALSHSGYGEHTRFILRSLKSQPDLFDVYLVNINWGATSWIWKDDSERRWIDFLLNKTIQYTQSGGQFDMSIQVTIPQEWEKMAPINIGATAGTETTKISPQWMAKCYEMDKIVVISEHTKYAFENTSYPATDKRTGQQVEAKVECPIEVVGYPVKEIEQEKLNLDLKYDFNFLTIGTWIVRKNLDNTIKWFVEEFHDQEVGLIVKTSMAKNSIKDRIHTKNKLENLLKDYKDRKCEVYLLHGDMKESEMTGLYNHPNVKALVSFSHGEGYGLPLFEAAYNGLPIIAPNWGGQVDFLNAPVKDKKGKVSIKPLFETVAYDIKPIQPEAVWENVLIKESMWCFPKEWNCKKSMRSVYKNYNSSKSKASKLQNWILENFPEQDMYQKFCDSIHKKTKEEEEWESVLNDVQLT